MSLLTSDVNEYTSLKQLILQKLSQSPECFSIVDRIKLKYKYNINSNRMFERINEPLHLFKILEKRACLSSNELKPFEDINKFLRDSEIGDTIKNIGGDSMGESSDFNNEKLNEINSLVVDKIGNKYRDLGRYLNIPENEIWVADTQYPTDVHARIWKLLSYAVSQSEDQDQYFNKLCKSLINCRRRDLNNVITAIWSR